MMAGLKKLIMNYMVTQKRPDETFNHRQSYSRISHGDWFHGREGGKFQSG